jgi:hypothetical protein
VGVLDLVMSMMFPANAVEPMISGLSPDVLWGLMTGQMAIVEVVEEDWDESEDESEWEQVYDNPWHSMMNTWMNSFQNHFQHDDDHWDDAIYSDFQ